MRSVLITGTSTGIGQATAVTLAARGWRVFATMRNLEKRGLLEQALKEAGVQNDVEIEQLDVTDTTAIRSAVASTLSQTGNKLDYEVCCVDCLLLRDPTQFSSLVVREEPCSGEELCLRELSPRVIFDR
jgi:NAD(P)-dependent dehydrogenase (short-subunit alcohol dehydrogenase family)